MRLLIVDDDGDLRASLADALCDSHAVKLVATSWEALASHPERFDAILTDYNMPAMTGLELHTVLLRRGVMVPMILMSSDPAVGWPARARGSGFWGFLAKPFDLSQLQTVLDLVALGSGPASSAA